MIHSASRLKNGTYPEKMIHSASRRKNGTYPEKVHSASRLKHGTYPEKKDTLSFPFIIAFDGASFCSLFPQPERPKSPRMNPEA